MEQGLLPTTSEEERRRSFTEQLLRSTATDEDADSPAPGSVQRSLSAGTAGDPKSSVFASVMNLSNTILGAGMLGLPAAFAVCGWVLGSILLAVFAFFSRAAGVCVLDARRGVAIVRATVLDARRGDAIVRAAKRAGPSACTCCRKSRAARTVPSAGAN